MISTIEGQKQMAVKSSKATRFTNLHSLMSSSYVTTYENGKSKFATLSFGIS